MGPARHCPETGPRGSQRPTQVFLPDLPLLPPTSIRPSRSDLCVLLFSLQGDRGVPGIPGSPGTRGDPGLGVAGPPVSSLRPASWGGQLAGRQTHVHVCGFPCRRVCVHVCVYGRTCMRLCVHRLVEGGGAPPQLQPYFPQPDPSRKGCSPRMLGAGCWFLPQTRATDQGGALRQKPHGSQDRVVTRRGEGGPGACREVVACPL